MKFARIYCQTEFSAPVLYIISLQRGYVKLFVTKMNKYINFNYMCIYVSVIYKQVAYSNISYI